MVVIVIIGIITAVTLPEMKGTFEEALLRSSGRRMAAALKMAHSQAVTQHTKYRVRVEPGTGKYWIEARLESDGVQTAFQPVPTVRGSEGTIDPRIQVLLTRGSEGDEEDDTRGGGRSQAAIPPEQDSLYFYPDGTSDPGQILLRDREGITLRMRLHPSTSRVRFMTPERREAP